MKPNLKPPLLLSTLFFLSFAAQLFGQNTNKINQTKKEKVTYSMPAGQGILSTSFLLKSGQFA